jgi:hypothetical protein
VDQQAFFKQLLQARTAADAEAALEAFEDAHSGQLTWSPIGGNQNNRGPIEVSADPGRSVVERITNAIDAVIELAHQEREGRPTCATPGQAATAWFGVPTRGVGELSQAERQSLADNVVVRLLEGSSREARTLEILDRGIGLAADEMPDTILSINRSNKLQKFYLAGTFGQGGSSTYYNSRISLLASKKASESETGFTLVRFVDLPPEQFKSGYYAYLTVDGRLPRATSWPARESHGTLVRHFGYELSKYDAALGPASLYGLFNQILFDPVLPFWLHNEVRGYKRSIAGARARLNNASTDESDDASSRNRVVHKQELFYIDLIDHGRVAIEYWVLEQRNDKQHPTRGFIDPDKPIILTLNGQNQCELSRIVVRKLADLPFLQHRLICHVKCDTLTPAAKRSLFTSTREQARDSLVLRRIQDEVVALLKADEELERLNAESRAAMVSQENDEQSRYIRKEVGRLLRIQGIEFAQGAGVGTWATDGEPGGAGRSGKGVQEVARQRRSRTPKKPTPIELREPPTYIRIVWEDDTAIRFYPGRQRWIRIETDAQSIYHDPLELTKSKLAFTLGSDLKLVGTTKLAGGRMMAKIRCSPEAAVGSNSRFQIGLHLADGSVLSDVRPVEIVAPPVASPDKQKLSMPEFEFIAVDGPEDGGWSQLGWPDDVGAVASHSQLEGAKLTVYYSRAFPDFVKALQTFEQRSPADAQAFELRYRIWLAVHSYLLEQVEVETRANTASEAAVATLQQADDEEKQRSERCRVARMAAMVAANEVKQRFVSVDD